MGRRHPIALAMLIAGWFCSSAVARAQDEAVEPPDQTRLVLQETATREVEQDTLVATLTAHAEAQAPRPAQAEVNAAITAAVEAAREVAAVRAATGGYRVYQEYDREGRPTNWVAEQDLRLTGEEPAPLLELVGTLQDDGLLLSGLGYELSREARRTVAGELTIEAIEALRARAGRIAETLGMQVERIDTLRVGGALDEPPVHPMMEMRASTAEDMAPPVALPDLQNVQASVEAEVLLAPR